MCKMVYLKKGRTQEFFTGQYINYLIHLGVLFFFFKWDKGRDNLDICAVEDKIFEFNRS